MSNKVQEIVTQKILKSLEEGIVPWKKPWVSTMPQNLESRKEYRGINLLLLWSSDFTSPYWLTFKQLKKKNGFIREGESPTLITFLGQSNGSTTKFGDGSSETEGNKRFLRYYKVWNLDQVSIPEENLPKDLLLASGDTRSRGVDTALVVKKWEMEVPIVIGHSAAYSPKSDTITMPNGDDFITEEGYFATVVHEIGHSTGHPKRMNRFEVGSTPSKSEYSSEELVAEVFSAFVMAKCNVVSEEVFQNQVSYIHGWRGVISNDPGIVIRAASAAQKAMDFFFEKVGEV